MSGGRYQRLDSREITRTVERLARRIEERFPDAGLGKVSRELCTVADGAAARTEELQRPNLLLRVGVGVLLAGAAGVLIVFIPEMRLNVKIGTISDLIQTVEALLGSLFFLGTGVAFLITLESRIKRRAALAVVHQLRALAHIVDMHQLTKDPDQLTAGPSTPSSPVRSMSDFELLRYLDYCSEMLALISKVGALTVQGFADPVVLGAVDEVENLTTGLSRKIWQKIMIVQPMVRAKPAPRPKLRTYAAGSSGERRRRARA